MANYCVSYKNGTAYPTGDGSPGNPYATITDVVNNLTLADGDKILLDGSTGTTIGDVAWVNGTKTAIKYGADITSTVSAGDYIKKASDNLIWMITSISYTGGNTVMTILSNPYLSYDSTTETCQTIHFKSGVDTDIITIIETYQDGYSFDSKTVIEGGYDPTFSYIMDSGYTLFELQIGLYNNNYITYYHFKNIAWLKPSGDRSLSLVYSSDFTNCTFYGAYNTQIIRHLNARNNGEYNVWSGCTFTFDVGYFKNWNQFANQNFYYCDWYCMYRLDAGNATPTYSRFDHCNFYSTYDYLYFSHYCKLVDCSFGYCPKNYIIRTIGMDSLIDNYTLLDNYNDSKDFVYPQKNLLINNNIVNSSKNISVYSNVFAFDYNTLNLNDVNNWDGLEGIKNGYELSTKTIIFSNSLVNLDYTEHLSGDTCLRLKYNAISDSLDKVIRLPIVSGTTYDFSFYMKSSGAAQTIHVRVLGTDNSFIINENMIVGTSYSKYNFSIPSSGQAGNIALYLDLYDGSLSNYFYLDLVELVPQ